MKWIVLLTFMAVKMKFTKLNGSCNILPKSMKWVKVLSKNLDCIRVLNSIGSWYYKDFFIVVQLIIIRCRGRWTGWKNMKFYENLNGNQIARK